MARYLAALLIAVIVAGCASAANGGTARGPRNVLSQEELGTVNATNLYEALQQVRPEFLRTRGVMTPQNPNPEAAMVYVNGVRAGGLEALRTLRTYDVLEVRYLSPGDATTRYGTGHTGGAIEVRTR